MLENKDFAAAVQTLAGTSAVVNAVKGDVVRHRLRRHRLPRGHPRAQGEEGRRVARHHAVARDRAGRHLPHRAASSTSTRRAQPTGAAKKFIDWVKSPEGQKVIEQVGYYPLPKG